MFDIDFEEFDLQEMGIEDTPLKQESDNKQVLSLHGYTVEISVEDYELSFYTYRDEPLEDGSNMVDFNSVHQIFDIKDLISIKRSLLAVIEEYFLFGGTLLMFWPTCPRRSKVYSNWLKKAGYRVDEDGDHSIIHKK